jgi:hypothetical protein
MGRVVRARAPLTLLWFGSAMRWLAAVVTAGILIAGPAAADELEDLEAEGVRIVTREKEIEQALEESIGKKRSHEREFEELRLKFDRVVADANALEERYNQSNCSGTFEPEAFRAANARCEPMERQLEQYQQQAQTLEASRVDLHEKELKRVEQAQQLLAEHQRIDNQRQLLAAKIRVYGIVNGSACMSRCATGGRAEYAVQCMSFCKDKARHPDELPPPPRDPPR